MHPYRTTLIVFLLLVSPAQGLTLDHEITQRKSVQISLDIATQFWGVKTCKVRHLYQDEVLRDREHVAETILGLPCFSWFRSDTLANTVDSRVFLCDNIVHEYGHWLLGPKHSKNPQSVMNAHPGYVQACFERFVPANEQVAYKRRNGPMMWVTK